VEIDIHRVKGRLVLDTGEVKMIQGVRDIFEIMDSPDRVEGQEKAGSALGKIVLIGRHLSRAAFEKDFAGALER